MKKSLVWFGVFCCLASSAQQGWYVESKTETKMMGMTVSTMNGKIWSKGDKCLMEMETSPAKYTMRNLTIGDQETMTMGSDCYQDTKENILKTREEKATIENINVKKVNDTKKILGYLCKKAIITYDAKSQFGTMGTENEVWYTDELKSEGDAVGSQAGSETGRAYLAAIKELGVILVTETTVKSAKTKSSTTVTKIEKLEIPDEKFQISTDQCKKVMNYADYQKEMDKRQRQSSAAFGH